MAIHKFIIHHLHLPLPPFNSSMAMPMPMAMAMAENSQQPMTDSQWILHINGLIQRDDLQTALQTPTSIFKLPDSVTAANPEPFLPSSVALGPYNHFQPKLYKMELYKLETAKEAAEIFHFPALNQIVEKLPPLELRIRACFDRYLEMESEAFAWKMAVDGLFLLRLLFSKNTHLHIFKFPLPMFEEQKLYNGVNGDLESQCAIVNDILKLQNQIPVLVLKLILPTNNLHLSFYQFCAFVSPIEILKLEFYDPRSMDPYLSEFLEKSHHLLHFLYLIIVNHSAAALDSPVSMAAPGSLFLELLNIIASVFHVGFLKDAIDLVQSLLGLFKKANQSSSSSEEDTPFSVIPSASKLEKVGVKFKPLNGVGLKSAGFNKETATLLLPAVSVNPFSGVIFRNLLAFEAAVKANEEDDDPYCFTQYVALMSSLMAGKEDAMVLKKAGIIGIYREFGSGEEEAVKMFDDLRKSIGSRFRGFMDYDELWWNSKSKQKMVGIIEGINEFYESCWRVKVGRFVEKYVFPLVKALFFVVVILLIFFVIVRTYCGWFSCPKIVHLLHYQAVLQNF